MKKQLLFLLFALLALCASAAPNDVFSVGDLTYSVTLDSYSGRPGIVAVKSLSAQGKAKTSLKLDIPGVVSYNGYKYKVGGLTMMRSKDSQTFRWCKSATTSPELRNRRLKTAPASPLCICQVH